MADPEGEGWKPLPPGTTSMCLVCSLVTEPGDKFEYHRPACRRMRAQLKKAELEVKAQADTLAKAWAICESLAYAPPELHRGWMAKLRAALDPDAKGGN